VYNTSDLGASVGSNARSAMIAALALPFL